MPHPIHGRGILYPTRLPTFQRVAAPAELADLIRWFWIPRWDIPPGRSSRQHVLAFPASNLVIESHGVTLAGPTTKSSYRDLRGTGWAVGALLRPAAIESLCDNPSAIRDTAIAFEAPDLHRTVFAAMEDDDKETTIGRATAAYATWVQSRLTPPDERSMLANAIEDLIASDPGIMRIGQLAERFHITARHVQRLMHRYVGLSPVAIIRRYRLQEAIERLREDSSLTIAQIAAELGYADHAHLTRDFRQALGLAPVNYRRDSRADAPD